MIDLLDSHPTQTQIHTHGFVRLVDMMPRLVPDGQTADSAVVQAARVSYGEGTKHISDDRGLIRYLMRHHHMTPFEMVEFKWHIKLPIFVARQWIRHRTASVNEVSARYSELPGEIYTCQPRKQASGNKQGSDGVVDNDIYWFEAEKLASSSHSCYRDNLSAGVAREVARMHLPLSTYTEWYWKANLRNTLGFFQLRMDRHAQEEIRVYADAMYEMLICRLPLTVRAWRNYHYDAMTLSAEEVEAIYDAIDPAFGKREMEEFKDKIERLRLSNLVRSENFQKF